MMNKLDTRGSVWYSQNLAKIARFLGAEPGETNTQNTVRIGEQIFSILLDFSPIGAPKLALQSSIESARQYRKDKKLDRWLLWSNLLLLGSAFCTRQIQYVFWHDLKDLLSDGNADSLLTAEQRKVLWSHYVDSVADHALRLFPSNILYVVGKGSAGIERVLSMNGFKKSKKQ